MFNTDFIVTTIIAIIALVLSIINFVIDRYDKSIRLSVILSRGVWETGSKKHPVDNGYLVKIINRSRLEISITDVIIEITQKKPPVSTEATTQAIIIKSPLIKMGNKNEDGYYFSRAEFLENYEVSLAGGKNTYYWFSDMEAHLIDDERYPFWDFEPNTDIKMKARVHITLGKSYYSKSINFHRKIKNKFKENKL
jgi:hypothetical protein